MHRFIRRAMSAVLLAVGVSGAQAAPFSNLYVFGDSLSDTGNLNALLPPGSIPSPPYFNGTFSNGPQWIATLAQGMGAPAGATPSFFGGNNYAVAGARTDLVGFAGTTTGVLAQIGTWANPLNVPITQGGSSPLGKGYAAADPDALYVLVAGGNDMRDSRNAHPTTSAADAAARLADAQTALANLATEMTLLRSRGAQHVLISNLPDLGLNPEAGLLGLRPASSDATTQFNNGVPALAAYGASIGLDVRVLDLAGLLNVVVDDAVNNGGAQYGITNVAEACSGFQFAFHNISCDVSLYSDALHPSARAHALIGMRALATIGLPEPQTFLLVGLAMAVLVVRRRRA